MRKVAGLAGVTAPALYRHFAGKGELVDALLQDARRTLLDYLLRSLSGADAWERLKLAQRAYLDFALEHRESYELLMLAPNQLAALGLPGSVEAWTDEPPATFQICIDRVAECMRTGYFSPADPGVVALTVTGLAHGLITHYLAGRFGDDTAAFERLYEASFEHLYTGLRPHRGAEPDEGSDER